MALAIAFIHGWWVPRLGSVPIVQAYFALGTALFLIGGILGSLKTSNALFRAANVGLILLSAIDNFLIVYSRVLPAPIFGRVFTWSTTWIPPGAVQAFVAQILLIIVSGLLLRKR